MKLKLQLNIKIKLVMKIAWIYLHTFNNIIKSKCHTGSARIIQNALAQKDFSGHTVNFHIKFINLRI